MIFLKEKCKQSLVNYWFDSIPTASSYLTETNVFSFSLSNWTDEERRSFTSVIILVVGVSIRALNVIVVIVAAFTATASTSASTTTAAVWFRFWQALIIKVMVIITIVLVLCDASAAERTQNKRSPTSKLTLEMWDTAAKIVVKVVTSSAAIIEWWERNRGNEVNRPFWKLESRKI